MKKKRALIIRSALILLFVQSITAFSTTQNEIAKLLHWKEGCTTSSHHHCHSCNGQFLEPKRIESVAHPPPYKTTRINISAKGPVIFRTNGESVLQKDVLIKQPGREIRADKAIIRRNKKTGKINDIQLIGHVSAQEKGKLIVGKHADFNVTKNIFTINHAVYHIAGTHHLPLVETRFDAWGTADSIQHFPNNVLTLKNATYSTCAPISPAWTLSAAKLTLDRNKGRGTARNVILRFKGIPVFYTPYYSFPTALERKTGFLTPNLGYATDHGFFIGEPFYWNIAPNYDLLLTPQFYSERGVMMSGLFRYVTHRTSGHFFATAIPDDRKFLSFKNDTLNSFSGKTISTNVAPYLSALSNMSNDRGYFDFENNTIYDAHWESEVALRYVTDPYFARDFSAEHLNDNTNQLPSFAELNYTGIHWHDTLLFQTYQTLHSLDHFTTPAQNQYTRLPELDFVASYPQSFDGFDLNLNAQFVHFKYFSSFNPFTFQRPIGNRIHAQPAISHPFNWSIGYVTPKLTVDSTSYYAENPAPSATAPRPYINKNRTLPILDVDSGLYFDRLLHFGHSTYLQTIEPRLFYLYTPYLNQNSYPNFDTQLLPFSFTDLFSLNRFTGFDRLQNANQLSIGLTSRILSQIDGHDILNAQLGLITYFSSPRVCLLPGCTITDQTISPISGTLTFNPSAHWSFSSSIAWDTALEQINNAKVSASFHLDSHHIAVLAYQFTHGNADTPFDTLGFSTNSSLITAGLVWPLNNRWRAFGYTYYNLTQSHPETEYYGLSYSTCCWALRVIVQNNFDGITQIDGGSTFQNRYTTDYFIEFLLKGLGSAGNNSAENLLNTTLPGFHDAFSNEGHYGYTQTM